MAYYEPTPVSSKNFVTPEKFVVVPASLWRSQDISAGVLRTLLELKSRDLPDFRNGGRRKGWVYYNISDLACTLGISKRTAQMHVAELRALGLVRREGKRLFVALIGECCELVQEFSPKEENLKKEKRLTQPVDNFLIEQIEEATRDYHSRGCWVNCVSTHPEDLLYQALSITKYKLATESGVNGGAYFLSCVRGLAALGEDPPDPLTNLQEIYPHIDVGKLFDRYKEIKPEAKINSFQAFIENNHAQLWETKPHYRRVRSPGLQPDAGSYVAGPSLPTRAPP